MQLRCKITESRKVTITSRKKWTIASRLQL